MIDGKGARTSRRLPLASAVVCGALFASAYVAAPYSCEGGLEAYFAAGVAALALLAGAPFALQRDASVLRRVLFAVGLVVLGAGVWLGGLVAAHVRIICRLF